MAHRLPLADIQFIADFAAYARSKGDEAYEYRSNDNCAVCQFLKATGRAKDPRAGGDYWRDAAVGNGWDKQPFPLDLKYELIGKRFSALADRLEALICDAPAVVRS